MSCKYPLWGLVILLGFSILQSGCTNAQSEPSEEDNEPAAVFPVEISEVTVGDISAFFTSTATLEAKNEAAVVAKASGVVQEILVEEGHFVRAGQPLTRLDSEQSALELAQLEANLLKMKNDLDRNEELFNKALISAETYDQIKFQYESQKASVDLARLKVDYATIKAPITGVISERLIKVGNMVALNAEVFNIVDYNPLHAIVHVPERELSKLLAGQEAALKVDALPETQFTGRIERISPIVDPTTGTFKVTVAVNNPGGKLKPGMLARVNITYDVHKAALLAPKEAVVIEDTEHAVYIVRDDTAFRQTVTVGYTDARSIEITSGLEAGDVIVKTGQGSLKDSSQVEVVQ